MIKSWREASRKILTLKEQEKMRASYDVLGDIAIVEIARGLEKKETRLGKLLLSLHPNIKVVAKKRGGHTGRFRRQPLKILAGESRLETTHRESGVSMCLEVSTCYFSPRLSEERLRISRLVKKDERVLVLFGGIGPFALVIAKHAKPARVDSVELNPAAHKYAALNASRNKLNVVAIKADAKSFLLRCAKAGVKYDRILLAWPGHAAPFLPAAIKCLARAGVLHYYDFAEQGKFDVASVKVKSACSKSKRKCRIIRVVTCGQKEPRVNRVCVDVSVS